MNLGTIGKRIRKIGRDTAAEVQKMNDIRQINSKINEQKKQISSIYTQIGQKLYKLYREAPLEGFDTEFQKIDERMETIEVYNDQIREIRGVRICPNCHTEISLSERYCSACGQKLPEIVYVQKDENGNMIIENSGTVNPEETADESAEEIEEEAQESAEEADEIGEEPEAAAKEADETVEAADEIAEESEESAEKADEIIEESEESAEEAEKIEKETEAPAKEKDEIAEEPEAAAKEEEAVKAESEGADGKPAAEPGEAEESRMA